jgi:hypothetical protein
MNKEFIPYEQAVDLESIGFDIRPDFGNQTSLYTKDGRHLFYTNYGVMGSGLGEGYIYAPTFSQAFRWFRSKGFVISLRSEYVEKHEYYIKWKPENSGVNSTLSHPFETYEEAELACLNKLIEIVKNKKD